MKSINYYRRNFLGKLSLGLGCTVLMPYLSLNAIPREKPNIILVMGDNLGFGDFGLSGNEKVRTPNIDRFASEGIQFSRFYANPMSAPTRASLMTGRYFYRTGVIHTSRGGAKMHGDEITIAEYLKKAGYVTGMFGKWHLGDNYPMRPQDQGFSQTLWHKSGRIGQVPDYPNRYYSPMLWKNGEMIQTEGYCTDVFTDAAIEFIEKNRDKPFFVYLPTNAGHTANEKVVGPLVPSKYSDPYREMGLRDIVAKVYGMVTNIDENFGRLLEKLDELNIRENTIVIFTTDDGPGADYNAGFRNGSVYESKMRVPFAVQWPAGLKNNSFVIDKIASHIDVLPTLLDAIGMEVPKKPVIDGMSLMPLLTGRELNMADRQFFFQCHRGLQPQIYRNVAVVGQRYKMVGYPDSFDMGPEISAENPVLELYDLIDDPGEENDLANEQPDLLRSMRTEYEKWFSSVKNTRNFKPGWISIGSEYELTTHLCRYQDASFHDDKPSGWPVNVEKSAKYEISVNRVSSNPGGTIFVKIGDKQLSQPLKPGEKSAVFNLPRGKYNLDIWFLEEGELSYTPRTSEDTIGDVDIKRL